MKKFLSILAVLVIIVAAGVGGLFLTKGEQPGNSFAAVTGPDNYNHLNFYLNHTDGGYVATSSLATAQPLAPKLLQDVTLINFTPNVSGITLTLPATSTISSFIPKFGDTQTVNICNATTTAAMPFTLALGTGMIASNATTTLAVGTGKCATVMFVRKPNTDMYTIVDIGT